MQGFALGVIEGFYGRPWPHDVRLDSIAWFKDAGFGFYIYAPKGDPFLRKRWRDAFPAEHATALAALSMGARLAGIDFGVGLSPFEIYWDFGSEARGALASKLEALDDIGTDLIGLLFDDMRGDFPQLAQKQAEIAHFVGERTKARRVILCPTYYSDDPVLERVFGKSPEGYLRELGRNLDPAIDVFWTGEKVVSKSYSTEHLSRVADELGRKPFLWDNYPVNDSAPMCTHLHIRPVEGRPSALRDNLRGHALNPMNQPFLSRIPLATQAEAYRLGKEYNADRAFREASLKLAGEPVGRFLIEDVSLLHDSGLTRLGEDRRAALLTQFGAHRGNPFADEVVDWLCGGYAFDPACLTD